MEDLIVKKWGGENAAEVVRSPNNIKKDFNNNTKQIVVVSAIRSSEFNTTDNLIKLSSFFDKSDKNNIYNKIEEIKNFHLDILKEKLGDSDLIEKLINSYFEDTLIKNINNWFIIEDKIFPNKDNDYSINTDNGLFSLIGFGEDLSAFIQTKLINNLGVDGLKAEHIDLGGITHSLKGNEGESNIFMKLSDEISKKVSNVLDNDLVPVIGGYIPGFVGGIENAIGRGYTDATAAMIAVGFSNNFDVILEIQKSVKGMLSADPRIVENAQLIEKVDYLTAKEITGVRGGQAKLLHSQVLRKELLGKGIKVKLFDPFSDSKGTIISRNKNFNSSGVEYIGARNNITFFSISSWDMSNSGILSNVFSIFKKYDISIDIVSTSETEISFTIDNGIDNKTLDNISDEIRKELGIEKNDEINSVNYEKNKALIFCIGQNLANSTGSLSRATSVLAEKGINIEIASQGSKERAIIFGIEVKDMNDAVKVLHNEFIK